LVALHLQAAEETSMRPEDIELSRRYADILRVRGNAERTIDNYLYALKGFAQFLGERGLKSASADDIVAYQIEIVASGRSDSCVRVATYALRGFLEHVLERADAKLAKLPRPRQPKRLPEVLSTGEVAAILDSAPSPKYRAAFMLCYGAGLRTDEVVHLLPRHIDSQRMLIRVEQGKGKKDRTVMLSKSLLEELRSCWRRYAPKCYLLEGKHPGLPIDATSIQRAFRLAREHAGVSKRVTPRSLRHAFATHLIERGTNLRVVQTLLGHQSLNTTAVYIHLAKSWLSDVKSPLDGLKEEDQKPRP
jgi:site-specific recombinase XerD